VAPRRRLSRAISGSPEEAHTLSMEDASAWLCKNNFPRRYNRTPYIIRFF
jgi:hypothetical protein